jgi:Ca-activated chloride channel family protein
LKYQIKETVKSNDHGEEMMNVKLRYKAPNGDKSLLIEQVILNKGIAFANASENFRFASCVAEFGMLLRNSDFKGKASFNHVFKTAKAAKGSDAEGYRKEFIVLVKKASVLKSREASEEDDDDDVVVNN